MMKKRIIQVMVALCLILTLMPMNAKAAEPTLTTSVWTKTEAGKVRVFCKAVVNNPPATDDYLTFIFYDNHGRYTRTEWVKNREKEISCEFGGEEAYAKVCLLDTETYVPLCESRKESKEVQTDINANFYDGDKLIDTRTVKNGNAYGELPVPDAKAGYKFLGWYTAAEGGTKITETSVVDSAADISLYAHWVKAEYKVSFYDGDKLIETRTVKNGDAYDELPDPGTKDGYEFLGWYTAAEGGDYVSIYTKPSGAEDIALYARWSKVKYLISCYDGDQLVGQPITVDRDTRYLDKLPDPGTKGGYTFLGWYTAAEGGEQITAATRASGKEDIVLYARWSKVGYTVSFYNGDEQFEPITVTLGEKYGDLPVPAEREGFHFLGWFTAAEDGDQITENTVVTTEDDVTLYAQWRELMEIPASVLDFGEPEDDYTYLPDPNTERSCKFDITYPEEGEPQYYRYEFKLKYKRQGDSEYLEGTPIDVGTYDVTVTRAADENYKAFEHTYEGVLVINKGVHYAAQPFVTLKTVGKGFTWFEFALEQTGGTYTEGATITYSVSADKLTWYESEPNSGIVYLPDYKGNDNHVRVSITNDPNWEDWSYQWNASATLLEPPVYSWSILAKTDWYDESMPAFTITTPEQLAGLAYLVNAGNSFEGKTIQLGSDINLYYCEWVPIGTKDTPFKGRFDGQGHTISNAYLDENYTYSGLFGYTSGAWVEDLNVLGFYIAANEYGGGIIGGAVNTQLLNCTSYAKVSSSTEGCAGGGLVGLASNTSILKCTNYGRLEGKGNIGGIVGKGTNGTTIDSCINLKRSVVTNSRDATGGIVGRGSDITVVNCLNYGQVTADVENTLGVGGIAGIVESGDVYNCVNFGPIKGYSTVGGIVGLNETADCELYNCYNVGSVYGSSTDTDDNGFGIFVGAVIGRNQKDQGTVKYCYYVSGSASSEFEANVLGAGTRSASTNSVEKNQSLDIGFFSSLTGNVESHWYEDQSGVFGRTLIDVLNAWQSYAEGYTLDKPWTKDPSGFPIPHTDAW